VGNIGFEQAKASQGAGQRPISWEGDKGSTFGRGHIISASGEALLRASSGLFYFSTRRKFFYSKLSDPGFRGKSAEHRVQKPLRGVLRGAGVGFPVDLLELVLIYSGVALGR